MFVGSALLWSKISPEFFEIARSYDDVVCIGCVGVFTLAVAVLLVVDVVLIFTIPICCKFGDKPSHTGAAFVCFCVLLLAIGFILIVSEPVWFARNVNIVTNYEESSEFTFNQQMDNKTIQLVWDKYQRKFKCCGYQGYKDYQKLFLNFSVPVSCCNTTTLPSPFECVVVIQNVHAQEINSSYIYTDGCPAKIVHLLNLDSSSVRNISIASAVFCSFFFLASIVMILLTFCLTARNKEDATAIGTGLLVGLGSIVVCCVALSKADH